MYSFTKIRNFVTNYFLPLLVIILCCGSMAYWGYWKYREQKAWKEREAALTAVNEALFTIDTGLAQINTNLMVIETQAADIHDHLAVTRKAASLAIKDPDQAHSLLKALEKSPIVSVRSPEEAKKDADQLAEALKRLNPLLEDFSKKDAAYRRDFPKKPTKTIWGF